VRFFTATRLYWVIAGQHSFTAAERIRNQRAARQQSIPRWCAVFRCQIVRADAAVEDIELLAGRLQAQSSNTVNITFAETLDYFHRLLQRERQTLPDDKISRTALLITTYAKTGKTILSDNTPVC
jgi:hypothetical protein